MPLDHITTTTATGSAWEITLPSCGGSTLALRPDAAFEMSSVLSVQPPTECFRAYAWTFTVIAVFSTTVGVATGGLAVALATRWSWHRVLICWSYCLGSMLRGLYFIYAANRIAGCGTMLCASQNSQFVRESLIPINALADLLLAAVDVLFVYFWIRLAGAHHRPRRRYFVLVASPFVALFVGTLLIDGVVYNPSLGTDPDLQWKRWRVTLGAIGSVMLVSALSHFGMIVRVFVAAVRNGWLIMLCRDVACLAFIALITFACSAARGALLLGRALASSSAAPTVSGGLSFYDPTFTAMYYIVLMGFPPIAVLAAFALLNTENLKEAARVEVGSMTPPPEGTLLYDNYGGNGRAVESMGM